MSSIIKLLQLDLEKSDDDSFDLDESIRELSLSIGWEAIFEETYIVLSTLENKSLWHGATSILFYAISDGMSFSQKSDTEIIARLYWCLSRFDNLGSAENGYNLVWSVVHQLKKVSYNSDWQPLHDKEIIELIKTMEV